MSRRSHLLRGFLVGAVLGVAGVQWAIDHETVYACPGPQKTAKLAVDTFALDYYLKWSLAHPDEGCPDLDTVARWAGRREEALRDPWGTPYRSVCLGSQVVIASAGPDKVYYTDDDLRSDRKAD